MAVFCLGEDESSQVGINLSIAEGVNFCEIKEKVTQFRDTEAVFQVLVDTVIYISESCCVKKQGTK